MGKGAKIAIGCAAVVVLAGIGVVAALMGGLWWAKGKAEQLAGDQQKIEALHKQADAHPFTRPADGVLQEARLTKFLDVRRQVYAVYEKHKDEIEALGKKKQGDFSDVTKGFALLNDLRLAHAQALADAGMSQDEYRYMVETIYTTLWASEVAKSTGGKSLSQATSEAYDQAAKAMEESAASAEQAEDGAAAAEETRDAVLEQAETLKKQGQQAAQAAKQMDVPPANIALFRKYEADIRKYAMGGLELLGF